MKKIFTLVLCFALICSLSVSSFAAGTPEPIYSNDSMLFTFDPESGVFGSLIPDFNYSFSGDEFFYFLIDGALYSSSINDVSGDHSLYVFENVLENGDSVISNFVFMVMPQDSMAVISLPCTDCSDEPHAHSVAIYDQYPSSSDSASNAPAFIAATSDGFKVMNSVITGIMSNPVLLFLLAASLIPVGIYLFKALKNAASRK